MQIDEEIKKKYRQLVRQEHKIQFFIDCSIGVIATANPKQKADEKEELIFYTLALAYIKEQMNEIFENLGLTKRIVDPKEFLLRYWQYLNPQIPESIRAKPEEYLDREYENCIEE